MKYVPIFLFCILSVTSCKEDQTETNSLKEKITSLEVRLDSLEQEIKELTEVKQIPTTKRKTVSKSTTIKSPQKETEFVLSQPSKEPAEKAGEERQYLAPQTTSKTSSSNYSSASRQCIGTTKKGARCKRVVSNGSYCWQH